MRNGKSFFKTEAEWNALIHYGLLLLGLLTLLVPVLVGWLRQTV